MKLTQLDRLSVLACATGLAMLAIYFVITTVLGHLAWRLGYYGKIF